MASDKLGRYINKLMATVLDSEQDDFVRELAWSELNHLRQSLESFLFSNRLDDDEEELEQTRKILLQEKKDGKSNK